MLNFKSRKGEIATLLTLGLVLVGTLITLGTSFFVDKTKNIASNPKAQMPCEINQSNCVTECGSISLCSSSCTKQYNVPDEGTADRVCISGPTSTPVQGVGVPTNTPAPVEETRYGSMNCTPEQICGGYAYYKSGSQYQDGSLRVVKCKDRTIAASPKSCEVSNGPIATITPDLNAPACSSGAYKKPADCENTCGINNCQSCKVNSVIKYECKVNITGAPSLPSCLLPNYSSVTNCESSGCEDCRQCRVIGDTAVRFNCGGTGPTIDLPFDEWCSQANGHKCSGTWTSANNFTTCSGIVDDYAHIQTFSQANKIIPLANASGSYGTYGTVCCATTCRKSFTPSLTPDPKNPTPSISEEGLAQCDVVTTTCGEMGFKGGNTKVTYNKSKKKNCLGKCYGLSDDCNTLNSSTLNNLISSDCNLVGNCNEIICQSNNKKSYFQRYGTEQYFNDRLTCNDKNSIGVNKQSIIKEVCSGIIVSPTPKTGKIAGGIIGTLEGTVYIVNKREPNVDDVKVSYKTWASIPKNLNFGKLNANDGRGFEYSCTAGGTEININVHYVYDKQPYIQPFSGRCGYDYTITLL